MLLHSGLITAWYSRHDSDILLCTQTSWAQVGSKRKQFSSIVHSPLCTRFSSFPTLAASSSSLHGGNGKTPGGLLDIQTVKEEASRVLRKNGETRCLQYFRENLRRWLSRIQIILLQIDRSRLTAVYFNRRRV